MTAEGCDRRAEGVCCACSSALCLRITAAATRSAAPVARSRFFATPARFGQATQAEVCLSTREPRPHSRPIARQPAPRGRANRAGIRTPAGE